MEALASCDGSIIPLEAPGNRGRGIPGKPGPWTLQWEEVEQGWCQSQKRPRGAKSPWGSRGGAPSEGDRTCLPGSMDVMGPGTGVTAIVEGTVADRSREVELSPALGDWPAANTKKWSNATNVEQSPVHWTIFWLVVQMLWQKGGTDGGTTRSSWKSPNGWNSSKSKSITSRPSRPKP